MEFRQHLGVIIIIAIICFFAWYFSDERVYYNSKWYNFIISTIFFSLIFEGIYWFGAIFFF